MNSAEAMRERVSGIFLPATVAVVIALASSLARAEDPVAECIAATDKGLELRKQGKLLDARRALADCATAACGAEINETCAQRITEISGALPTIIFAPKNAAGQDLSSVKLTIDGVPLAEALDGRALTVDPGKHVFVFAIEGQPRVERDFILREGEKDRREPIVLGPPLTVVTTGPTAPQNAPPAVDSTLAGLGKQRTIALIAGGIGIVGLGIGAGFGLSAQSKWSDAQKECGSACPASSTARGTLSDARSAAAVSNIAFAVGAVALAAGAVVWFTTPGSRENTTSLRVAPWVGTRGGGVGFDGSF